MLTPVGGQFLYLAKGRAGNLQTAAEMARLVREDTMRDEGLTRFAAQLLINAQLDSHSDTDAVLDRVFRYVQTIKYIHDPGGAFDSINSARETIGKGYGDCDDLAVLLATLLGCLGFTPAFVLAKYSDATSGFDHVYVEVENKGERITLDPTTRKNGIGWESPKAIERVVFPIFGPDGAFNALASAGHLTGAAIGLGLGIADRVKRAAQACDRWQEGLCKAMLRVQARIDRGELTEDEGVAAARAVADKFQSCAPASAASATTAKDDNAGGLGGQSVVSFAVLLLALWAASKN